MHCRREWFRCARERRSGMVKRPCPKGLPTSHHNNAMPCAVTSYLTPAARGRKLPGPGGIQREELLRLRDPAQRVAADRYEPAAHALDIGERLRDQHRLLDRAAHGGDAARFVDGRPHHGEIEPLGAAEIAVEHLADMQAEIHVGDRQAPRGAPVLWFPHFAARGRRGGERGRAGARTDRKSTRLNSSHSQISYAVFCLKKKKNTKATPCAGITFSTVVGYWLCRYCLQGYIAIPW